MKSAPGKELIEEVALEKGIDEAFVEKDWYVTQVIKMIADYKVEGFQMIFTGGTALSKAHGLLQRFSEDIDFRVICPGLAASGKSQQRKLLSDFKRKTFTLLRDDFDVSEDKLFARNDNHFFSIELDYPTAFNRPNALRPHILTEFTVTSLSLPVVRRSVSSFINELTKQKPEVETIDCIDPVENATDKLSALVWRIPDRNREDTNDDPTIVRHIHDLSILSDYAIGHTEFRRLAIDVIRQDDERCKKIAGLPLKEKFGTAIAIIEQEKEYSNEYDRFVKGMSYAATGSVPSFGEAVAKVRLLIEHVLEK